MCVHIVFQKQPNSDDCGLFSIANAMAIINEQEPELLNYDVDMMRRHLAGCLEDEMIRHFPAKKRSLRKMTRKTETMGIYCVCRMPEEAGKRMICCDIPAKSGTMKIVFSSQKKHGKTMTMYGTVVTAVLKYSYVAS